MSLLPKLHSKYVPAWKFRNCAYGPDVSHWKPVRSWTELEHAGVSFMGIKATEGKSLVDPILRAHREGFRASKLDLGIYYHFARSGSPSGQADHLIRSVGRLRSHERLALDLEVVPVVGGTAEENMAWISEFTRVCRDAYPDRPLLVYTSLRIWRQLGDPEWKAAPQIAHLWVPRYNTIAPRLPRPWLEYPELPDIPGMRDLLEEGTGWTFWQWTDGDVPSLLTPGIGRCDMNIFRGTRAELRKYARESERIPFVATGPALAGIG